MIAAGTTLRPRSGTWGAKTAVVTEAGLIVVDDQTFDTPSRAGRHVRGGVTNGWTFWSLEDGRRLADVRQQFRPEAPSAPDEAARHWDPETDLDDASEYWAEIGDRARSIFAALVAAAPEPVPAPVLAERVGEESVRSLAGALAFTDRAAAKRGHRMPSRFVEGNPSSYWMDESTAETFAAVINVVEEERAELPELSDDWAEAIRSGTEDEAALLRVLSEIDGMPVPAVGDELRRGHSRVALVAESQADGHRRHPRRRRPGSDRVVRMGRDPVRRRCRGAGGQGGRSRRHVEMTAS